MSYLIEQAVIFEKTTGRVLCSGTFQMLDRMVTETRDVLRGVEAVPNESYVSDGRVVAISSRPSEFYDFDWVLKHWVPNTFKAWEIAKGKRDSLLLASDWVVTKSTERNEAVSTSWMAYRQALRDITLQSDPLNLVWPVEP